MGRSEKNNEKSLKLLVPKKVFQDTMKTVVKNQHLNYLPGGLSHPLENIVVKMGRGENKKYLIPP